MLLKTTKQTSKYNMEYKIESLEDFWASSEPTKLEPTKPKKSIPNSIELTNQALEHIDIDKLLKEIDPLSQDAYYKLEEEVSRVIASKIINEKLADIPHNYLFDSFTYPKREF
jgi:hypothetical protein